MSSRTLAVIVVAGLLVTAILVAYELPRLAFRGIRRVARVIDWSVERVTRGV